MGKDRVSWRRRSRVSRRQVIPSRVDVPTCLSRAAGFVIRRFLQCRGYDPVAVAEGRENRLPQSEKRLRWATGGILMKFLDRGWRNGKV